MRYLAHAGKLLLLDLASTLLFVAVFLLTGSIALAAALGIGLGLGQIGWEIARKRPIDTMQWVSLAVVLASGAATIISQNPRFMMIKLSVVYAVAGAAMLKPGWLNRYQPPIAMELLPDVVVMFGYAWAGLMFLSAGVNVAVALSFSVATWASFMSAYGIVSKLGLFFLQYATMRVIGRRRRRAQVATLAVA